MIAASSFQINRYAAGPAGKRLDDVKTAIAAIIANAAQLLIAADRANHSDINVGVVSTVCLGEISGDDIVLARVKCQSDRGRKGPTSP